MATSLERAAAWARAVGLGLMRPQAERRRQRASCLLGRAVAALPAGAPAVTADPATRLLLADVQRQRDEAGGFQTGLARSLEADREDYARVASPLRGVVILRGLLDRVVLRHRRRQHEKSGRPLAVALGARVVDEAKGADGGVGEALAPLLARAREAAAAHRALEEAYQRRLGEAGGQLFPRWARFLGRELAGMSAAIAKEASARLLPKASALAGLAVGWVLARSFTTSRWDGFLNELGLYEGSARVVSRAEYERMQLWLPLIAAAICSYLAGRLAAVVRRRYAPAEKPPRGDAAFESTSATQISPR